MQKIDTIAISAPQNIAHAIATIAISSESIEPSEGDADELSVDGELDTDDPELFSDGHNNVCAPALTSNKPWWDSLDLAVGSFVNKALFLDTEEILIITGKKLQVKFKIG